MSIHGDLPLVTVYIPTYNRPEMLERAVNSLANQSYDNLEILVVDDNSDPIYQQKLQQLSIQKGFTLLTNSHQKGACGARNTAITNARGMYITGLDDDDEFLPDRIEQMLNAFDAEKYAAVSTTTFVQLSNNEQILRNADQGTFNVEDQLHYNKIGNQVLTLTERLNNIGGFDENMPAFQDYDAWVRLSCSYGPILKIDQPSYITHTEHENRISSSSRKKEIGLQIFREKHASLLNKGHNKSLRLLEMQHSGNKVTLRDLVSVISASNWKPAISLYLDQRMPSMAKRLRLLKAMMARVR